MRDTDLYSRLLDISEPWSVSLIEIDTPVAAQSSEALTIIAMQKEKEANLVHRSAC
jgi:hypothetical protein